MSLSVPLQHSGSRTRICMQVTWFVLAFFRVLPKSARWLMANDRKEEAWELIRRAAQMNGKPLTKDLEMCQVSLFILSNLFKMWTVVTNILHSQIWCCKTEPLRSLIHVSRCCYTCQAFCSRTAHIPLTNTTNVIGRPWPYCPSNQNLLKCYWSIPLRL